MLTLSYAGRKASFDPSTLEFNVVDENTVDSSKTGAQQSGRIDSCVCEQQAQTGKDKQVCENRLERLVLNVANICNLNCVYCYAQGGDYGGPEETMSAEIGRASLDKFFHLYDEISSIQFFGGEPLLNWTVVKDLCSYSWQLADSLGKKRPTCGLVSNGTILTSEIVDMIRTYNMRVTNSLDGPPAINDRLRITKANQGTSSIIEKNIKWLRSQTAQPGQIEGTFTRLHVHEHCSVVDVMDYIQSELGVNILHMPVNIAASGGSKDSLALQEEDFEWVAKAYADAVAKSIRSLVTEPVNKAIVLNSALEIIQALIKGEVPAGQSICKAGKATIAVDSNGEVYPCFMFYRQDRFNIGSTVDSEQPLVDEQKRAGFIKCIDKSQAPALSKSWAQRFFHGCAGGNYFNTGHPGTVLDFEVKLTEAMVTAAVVELAHLRQNQSVWNFLPKAIALFNLYQNTPV